MATRANTSVHEVGRLDRAGWVREVAYAVARGLGMGVDDAEDCAQACVLRQLEVLGPELAPGSSVRDPEAWLRAAVRHDAQDYLRRLIRDRDHSALHPGAAEDESRATGWGIVDDGVSPEVEIARAVFWDAVIPAIKALNEEQYVCFTLRYFLHLQVKEIASFLGATENHVSKALRRAERRVRAGLEAEAMTVEALLSWLNPPPTSARRWMTGREPEEASAERNSQ